jgi:hypothetical protein
MTRAAASAILVLFNIVVSLLVAFAPHDREIGGWPAGIHQISVSEKLYLSLVRAIARDEQAQLHADCSIPPPRDQSVALVPGHFVFIDRLTDRALLVRRVDDADESGGRPLICKRSLSLTFSTWG